MKSAANGDGARESALYGFRCLYGGLSRAIDSGALVAVPAPKDWNGPNVEVAGRRFMLDESSPGALAAVLDAEPAVMARTAETMEKAERMIDLAENLIKENLALRAALHPFEETTMIARRDPATNELQSTYAIKRLG